MRFLHADLESGSSFEHRHLGHRQAAHPERDGETVRPEAWKLEMRLPVEGNRLSWPAGDEWRGALHEAGASESAIQRAMREQPFGGSFRESCEAGLLPCLQ